MRGAFSAFDPARSSSRRVVATHAHAREAPSTRVGVSKDHDPLQRSWKNRYLVSKVGLVEVCHIVDSEVPTYLPPSCP